MSKRTWIPSGLGVIVSKNQRITKRLYKLGKIVKQSAWVDRHIVKPTKSELIEHADKVMFAENEFYHGEAVWKFELGTWRCAQANECLKFLLKKDSVSAKLDLIRRGFTWRWI